MTKEMWRFAISAVFAISLCGVVHADVPDRRIATLNARAADGKLDRATRCAAVFELFENHLAPGMTGAMARGAITDPTWLTGSDEEQITVLGGEIPVELTPGDSTFIVRCLATPRPDLNNLRWSEWNIYGRISGTSAHTFGAFLRASDVKLIEYALVFPDGRINHYGPKPAATIRAKP